MAALPSTVFHEARMFQSAATPRDEVRRNARLHALAVLDSEPEPIFDALTRAAAEVCGAPVALIGLLDGRRAWFKSVVGLSGLCEVPRELSLCAHVVVAGTPIGVPDLAGDERFADHPLAEGPSGLRSFAGAPITLSDGTTVGALCVFDHRPHALGEQTCRALRHLAEAVAEALEFRESTRRSIDEADRTRARMDDLYRSTPAPLFSMGIDGTLLVVSDTWLAETGYARDEVIGRSVFELLTPESRAFALTTGMPTFLDAGRTEHHEYQVMHKDGSLLDILVSQRLEHDADGRPLRSMSVFENITLRRRAEHALRDERERMVRILEGTDAGTWELNVQTGETRYNERWAEIAGYTLTELGPTTGETWRMLMHPDDLPDAVRLCVEHYEGRLAYYVVESRIRHKDGSWVWILDRGRVSARDGEGKPLWMHGTRSDITQRKQMETDLARSRELLQVTLDSIADAVITTDTAGIVQWLNPVAERMTGWTKADAVGTPLADVFTIVDEETRASKPDPVAMCLARSEIVEADGHVTLIARNGTEYGIEDSAAPIREAGGRVHGAVLVFHDVSEQRRLSHEMSHRATHDILPGLFNRCEFESRLARLLESAGDGPAQHALLYIDLDQFKLVNDACGHGAGDQLLRQVATMLRGCVRTQDSLARLGGDEFGAILTGCDVSHAQRVAQKICDQMDAFRFVHEGRRFRVGTSIGLAPIDRRWTGTKALLQAADAACYAAKNGGRNRVHAWFDSDQVVKARHGEMQWVSRLELALDEDRFELFGQRIESIAGTNPGLHFEVLLRLRESNGLLVPPGAFLPAAERFHLATRIDRWVVRKAFDWMRVAQDDGVDVDMMSINLSGQSLGDRAFHRDVVQMVRRASFDVRRLCFEITETAAITQMTEARTFIDEVRALGVRIALDDFGAGASSFGYLKSLPVDYLKIDGHFITNLLDDKLANVTVRCFCDVAKVVGVKTIAEFVEREDVRDALRDLGVDMAQGYLIHRPESLASLLSCVIA